MEASDSRSRTLGMDFFIPFPFPNFGNAYFSFPSRSRIMRIVFFQSLPVPKLWEWIFSFPSRSRIVGMDFFHSLPVPEFALFPGGNPNGNWNIVRDTSLQIFSASSTFLIKIYIEEVHWAMENSVWLKRQGILISLVANKLCCKGNSNHNRLVLMVAVTTIRRWGIIKNSRGYAWEHFGPKIFLTPHIF